MALSKLQRLIQSLSEESPEMPSLLQRIFQSLINEESPGDYQLRDWREDQNLFRIRAKHARENGILTDVNFIVGPLKKPFAAHKIILGLASPVFEAMFFGSLKESNDTIHVPDIMPCGFKKLLDYVYSDSIDFNNEAEIFPAWFAAEKFGLTRMKSTYYQYLIFCPINSSNVWTMLHNALISNLPEVIDRCGKYLKFNTSQALQAPTFIKASKESIEYLVMLNVLNIKEIELLKSLVKWGKEREGADESIQQILQPFMKYIRFACMTQVDLLYFVHLHKNIISDKDVIELLKYMSDNKFFSLPEWCSANVFPRNAEND